MKNSLYINAYNTESNRQGVQFYVLVIDTDLTTRASSLMFRYLGSLFAVEYLPSPSLLLPLSGGGANIYGSKISDLCDGANY